MARAFYPLKTYTNQNPVYRLLPFRFIRLERNRELFVNEAGEFILAPNGTAHRLIKRQLEIGTELYTNFKAKQFITDDSSSSLLDVLATKYRTKHNFMEGSTKLHIFVVTLRCDHSCHYCQVSRQTTDKSTYDMSIETAKKSIDLMMSSPSKHLTMELQGGEPLLAMDLIRFMVPLAKAQAKALDKNLEIVITTNLANATDDILTYCRDENIKLSTSLDGPAFIHNANRPRPGNNSYELAIENIERARRILGHNRVAALMTTTQLSLQHPKEIIDEYVRQRFHSIFLRPLSPYGFAVKSRKKTGYQSDSFLKFYVTGLEYILTINKAGYDIAEVYAKILLTKILSPYGTGFVDLQSPAGAGLNVLVYNYDGNVYATDESRMLAEMGDHTFRLGNVHTHDRKQIFTDEAFLDLLTAASNQTLPGCSDCAFQVYCGADPVFHHTSQGDRFGNRPTSGFCHRNMEIIKYLFEMISKNDKETMQIFFAWINNCGIEQIKQATPS